ncbi:MAG: acetyltransferase, partial [Victivallales bacterium]|nr:acetyltransferase [Victivallales bacterium]
MNVSGKEILLYGGSGHAKVIVDCLVSRGLKIAGIFDDNPELASLSAIPVIGSYDRNRQPELPLIISIGNNLIRKRLVPVISHNFAGAVHASAVISPSAVTGEGCAVIHGAVIQAGTVIGSHCIINTGAVVDHDCRLSDFVHISPGAVLCGNVKVGEGSHIGAGATIIQGKTIGKWATVGAGAAVISDIPDYAVAVGC